MLLTFGSYAYYIFIDIFYKFLTQTLDDIFPKTSFATLICIAWKSTTIIFQYALHLMLLRLDKWLNWLTLKTESSVEHVVIDVDGWWSMK